MTGGGSPQANASDITEGDAISAVGGVGRTPANPTVSPQTFTFTGRDQDGYGDIARMYFLINGSATTTLNICYGYYDRPTNAIYLYNDALTGVLGPITPGAGGNLQNAQCTVDGSASSVAFSAADPTW